MSRRLAVAGWALALGIQASPPPAQPIDPVTGILDAFKTHPIVTLSEGAHGNEQGHAFRLALIRDARFPAIVNDIVVEFGTARYQDVIDRFVRGDAVDDGTLRRVWQDTTQPTTVWDLPIYEEFFRAVRAVNASLAPERQIRVLLGDPAVDWSRVQRPEDLARQQGDMARDRHPADVIRREVVAKNRRALVIYGDGHLQRRDVLINFEASDPSARLLLMRLESEPPVSVFSIWTNTSTDLGAIQSDVSRWPIPSLAVLRGTRLGAADVTVYTPGETPRFANTSGGPDFSAPLPRERWRAFRMEDQVDAVLYLGPPSAITMSRLRPDMCRDTAYLTMRLQRLTATGMMRQADQLKRYCETPRPPAR